MKKIFLLALLIAFNYSSFASDDFGGDTATASVVNIGNTISGSNETSDDLDFFKFTLSQVSKVNLTITSGTGANVCLYDEGDRIDSISGGSIVKWLEAKTYFIKVSKTSGSYTITTSSSSIAPTIGVSNIITSQIWDLICPSSRLVGESLATAYYTYSNFITAANDSKFSNFGNEGNAVQRLRDIAGFLANTGHETNGGSAPFDEYNLPLVQGGFAWVNEGGKTTFATWNGTAGSYCDANSTIYPPVVGHAYNGRGPIQISWNYNYGAFSEFMYGDKNILLNAPENVANDGALGFKSALWFWMAPQGKKPSCHGSMINNWDAQTSSTDKEKINNGLSLGLGLTVNIINGGVEGTLLAGNQHGPKDRIAKYRYFCRMLQVSPGQNLETDNMNNFNNITEGGKASGTCKTALADPSSQLIVEKLYSGGVVPKLSDFYKDGTLERGSNVKRMPKGTVFIYDYIPSSNDLNIHQYEGDGKYYIATNNPSDADLGALPSISGWGWVQETIYTPEDPNDYPIFDIEAKNGLETISDNSTISISGVTNINVKPINVTTKSGKVFRYRYMMDKGDVNGFLRLTQSKKQSEFSLSLPANSNTYKIKVTLLDVTFVPNCNLDTYYAGIDDEYINKCVASEKILTFTTSYTPTKINNNNDNIADFSISSNPITQQSVKINVSVGGNLKVYDVNGSLAESHTLLKGENIIDVDRLSSGTYFFVFKNSEGKNYSHKVVVVK